MAMHHHNAQIGDRFVAASHEDNGTLHVYGECVYLGHTLPEEEACAPEHGVDPRAVLLAITIASHEVPPPEYLRFARSHGVELPAFRFDDGFVAWAPEAHFIPSNTVERLEYKRVDTEKSIATLRAEYSSEVAAIVAAKRGEVAP